MPGISVNKVLLIGSLEKDPELRYTSTNTAICQLRVVTTEAYVNRDGQQAESKSTHTVVVWGQRGERIKDQVRAGSWVHVEGSIRNRSYEDTSGNKKWVTEVNAQTIFPTSVDEGAPNQLVGQGSHTQPQGGNYSQPQQSQPHNTPQQSSSTTPTPTTQEPAPVAQSSGTNQGPPPAEAKSSSVMPENDLPF